MSEEGLRNPFVIQCKSCKKILSDSFTLQNIQDNYLIHTYSTVSAVEKSIPGTGIFAGCNLTQCKCTCGFDVGFFLVSVSDSWNGYAGMYCFNKDSITSYLLGNVVYKEKGMSELVEDVERLKNVVAKIYKKVYQWFK